MKWRGAVLLTLLLALPGSGATADAAAPDESPLGEFIPAAPPQPAPAISFTDADGNTLSLADFTGKLVLVNLWATWCAPCVKEMPSLEQLQARLGDRITILAISEDHGGTKVVEPFVDKLGLDKVKIYLDPKSAVGRAFAIEGLPTSLLIDGEGRVLGRVAGGAAWNSPKMLDALKPFLPPAPADGVIKSSWP